MAKTVVCLVDSATEAEGMVGELTSNCGCERSDIGLMARGEQSELGSNAHAGDSSGSGSGAASGALKGAGTGAAVGGVLGLVAGAAALAIPGFGPVIAAGPIAAALAGAGVGAVAGGVIGGLTNMGVPEDEAHYYAEGVRRGGTLITVHARTDEVATCAAEVMRKHGAADIEQRAASWKQEGWSGKVSAADEEVLPVAEQQLAVGKREVSTGGVRVYSRVIETPVEETVQLREEHARIERLPVDRPAATTDDVFQERSFEVRETAEEPVIEKRTRVTEEVRVGKEATQRKQTVRDTVKKTEVQVEKSGNGAFKDGADRRKGRAPFPGTERRTTLN